jgi:selenocysteine lyase/cysteine desulfurase
MRQLLDALRLGAGRRVIVSRSTYVSQALQLLTLRAEAGIDLVIVPNDESGSIDLDALDKALAGTAEAVVCVAHIPTSSGIIEPVSQIGKLVARHGGIFVLDATQSVGQLEIDVQKIGCDVLVTTGRKFLRAPRGTGLAYVSRSLLARLVPVAPDVRAASWTGETDWELERSARMLESWEHSVAGRIGLGVALGQALERGMAATSDYVQLLARQVRDRLAQVPGVVVTDPVAATSAIVTFRLPDVPDSVVYDYLKERNIYTISIPAAHAQWDLGARGLPSVVRASVHVYNDTADVDALVSAVIEIATRAGVPAAGVLS